MNPRRTEAQLLTGWVTLQALTTQPEEDLLAEHNYSEKMASERAKFDLVEGDYGRLSMSLLQGFKEQNSI